ncbi:isoprenyl transferase [Zavarzinia compransoris]|uniref:Isoprenyl transferase n=1 Tax=Zavarzinia compransoris TaxID=1264899 RepID=A0A317EBX4_9PROT|nr:isoprenyl transferase [Zavarzinia compransoris]PWR24112.1 isoprenyl transferase [Zavarzinia compransoris]
MKPAIEQRDAALPRHVAVIMDGNGRWAKARLLPRVVGHQRGSEAVRRVVEAAADFNIEYLTLYAFSSENWKRPEAEIGDLMGLLRLYLRRDLAELHANGVRIRVIGDRARLAPDILGLIDQAESKTRDNRRLTVTLAISYGGQAEIVRAARSLAEDVAAGRLAPAAIDEALFASRLETAGIPDPDLVIRTSGEKRLSNFLLWQAAYAEFIFVDTLWPDFGREELASALREYQQRDRRFGARKE